MMTNGKQEDYSSTTNTPTLESLSASLGSATTKKRAIYVL